MDNMTALACGPAGELTISSKASEGSGAGRANNAAGLALAWGCAWSCFWGGALGCGFAAGLARPGAAGKGLASRRSKSALVATRWYDRDRDLDLDCRDEAPDGLDLDRDRDWRLACATQCASTALAQGGIASFSARALAMYPNTLPKDSGSWSPAAAKSPLAFFLCVGTGWRVFRLWAKLHSWPFLQEPFRKCLQSWMFVSSGSWRTPRLNLAIRGEAFSAGLGGSRGGL